MAGSLHRLRQVRHYLEIQNRDVTSPLLNLLTPQAMTCFRALSSADQQHALAVATSLDNHGASKALITAGLLHDIGKAVPGVDVHLTDRVAKVALERFAPKRLGILASRAVMPTYWRGLWVLSRHAHTGSELATSWGYSARVSWLIAHHEDTRRDDAELRLLAAADEESLPPPHRIELAHG